VEQRKKSLATKDSDARLLLMEEEWLPRWMVRDSSSSSSDNCVSNGNNNGGKTSGKGKSGGKQSTGSDRKGVVGRDDICSCCGEKGHWARECRKKRRDEAAQVNVPQGDEEEQSLLLAHGVVISPASGPRPSPTPTARYHIHIEEQQVFADLREIEDGDRR
jgi:hypothetical protein